MKKDLEIMEKTKQFEKSLGSTKALVLSHQPDSFHLNQKNIPKRPNTASHRRSVTAINHNNYMS